MKFRLGKVTYACEYGRYFRKLPTADWLEILEDEFFEAYEDFKISPEANKKVQMNLMIPKYWEVHIKALAKKKNVHYLDLVREAMQKDFKF